MMYTITYEVTKENDNAKKNNMDNIPTMLFTREHTNSHCVTKLIKLSLHRNAILHMQYNHWLQIHVEYNHYA